MPAFDEQPRLAIAVQTLTSIRSQAVNLTKSRICCPNEPKLFLEVKVATLSTECTINYLVLLDGL